MSLIKCSECSAEVSDKASGCPKCGNPLSGVAPLKTSRYCRSCGQQVNEKAVACTDFWLDEPALFPEDELLVFALIQKIRKRASVLISGCSQTSELQVFRSSMSMLMAVADHIEVCKADCDDCGREEGATRSWALKPKSNQVRVGGKEAYIAVCRKCWTKRSEARARTGILIA